MDPLAEEPVGHHSPLPPTVDINASGQRESMDASEEDANTNPYEHSPKDDDDGAVPSDTSSSVSEHRNNNHESAAAKAASEDSSKEYGPPLRPTSQYADPGAKPDPRHQQFPHDASSVNDSATYASVGTGGNHNKYDASANNSRAFPDSVMSTGSSVGGAPPQVQPVGGPGGPGRSPPPSQHPVGGAVSSPMPSVPVTADSSAIHPQVDSFLAHNESVPISDNMWGHYSGAANPAPQSMTSEEYYGGGFLKPPSALADAQQQGDAHAANNSSGAPATQPNTGHPPPGSLEARRRQPQPRPVFPAPSPQPLDRRTHDGHDAPHPGAEAQTANEEGRDDDDSEDGGSSSYYTDYYYSSYYYYYSEEYEYYEEFFDEEVEEDELEDEVPHIDVIEGAGHGRTMHDILHGVPKAGVNKRGDYQADFRGISKSDSPFHEGSHPQDLPSRESTPERYQRKGKKATSRKQHPIEKDIAKDLAAAKKNKGKSGYHLDLDGVGGGSDDSDAEKHEPVTIKTKIKKGGSRTPSEGGGESDEDYARDVYSSESGDDGFSQPSRGAAKRRDARKKTAKESSRKKEKDDKKPSAASTPRSRHSEGGSEGGPSESGSGGEQENKTDGSPAVIHEDEPVARKPTHNDAEKEEAASNGEAQADEGAGDGKKPKKEKKKKEKKKKEKKEKKPKKEKSEKGFFSRLFGCCGGKDDVKEKAEAEKADAHDKESKKPESEGDGKHSSARGSSRDSNSKKQSANSQRDPADEKGSKNDVATVESIHSEGSDGEREGKEESASSLQGSHPDKEDKPSEDGVIRATEAESSVSTAKSTKSPAEEEPREMEDHPPPSNPDDVKKADKKRKRRKRRG